MHVIGEVAVGFQPSKSKKMRSSLRSTSAVGLALCWMAGTASAQDSQPVVLPPVSVEGQVTGGYKTEEAESPKFTAPLIDTPQTIAVIPKAVFQQQGAENLTEVLRNTPGITFNAGENGFASGLSNFSMRGFDTAGNIFIDGFRDSGNYSRDVFNLEQVEVVKGPAADNGRGGPGGYVNLVSKTPHLDYAVSGGASFGLDEYDSKERGRAYLDVNHPLSETAAIRMNVLWQDGGVAGREVAEKQTWGAAPSIAFGLSTPTRFTLAYQYLKQNDLPDWGVPGSFINGMVNHDPAVDAKSLRDNFYGLASDFDAVASHSVLARIEHDSVSGWEVLNQTRWSHTERNAAYTLPANYDSATQTVTTQRQAYARQNESIANQTNLHKKFMTGSVRHSFSTGFELSYDTSAADRFGSETNPGSGTPISIFNPDSQRAGSWNDTPGQTADVKVTTFAGYAYDTLELNEQWQVTGGLRVEHYKVTIDSATVGGAPQGPDGYAEKRTTVGGKLGIVYKPAPNGSIYASVGLSAQPPASFLSNPDISREGDNAFPGFNSGVNSANAKTQRAINFEIGAKWDLFDGLLSTTAAVFRTERLNAAHTGIDPTVTPQPPVTLLGYGKQVIQGAEFGVAGQITPEWSIFGGLLLMDSERKHSEFLDAGRRLARPNDYGAALRTSGDELAFTPNVSANLWTSYRLSMGLTLAGGLQYAGSSWLGRTDDHERIIPNGTYGELPDYVVFNAMAEYEVNESVLVRLNVDNITNEFYAVSANWNGRRVLLGPSRSFLLSTHFNF